MSHHMTRAQQRAMFAKRGRTPHPIFGYEDRENRAGKEEKTSIERLKKQLSNMIYYRDTFSADFPEVHEIIAELEAEVKRYEREG